MTVDLPLNWEDFRLEYGEASNGLCDCCRQITQSRIGFVYLGEVALAAYFVRWTERAPDHGSSWDLIIGPWGGDKMREHRRSVALDMRVNEDGPTFMVVDAGRMQDESMSGSALRRDEVIGAPVAAHVFALVDSIWAGDSRLEEIRNW